MGTNWDGVDMDQIGPGCGEGSNGTSGVIDFKSIKIYAHPDD